MWAICWISFYAYRQLDFYAFKSEIPFQHLNVCKWKFILTLFFLSLFEHFNFLAYYIRDDCLRFKIITGGSFLSSTLCCCHLKWRKCERLSVWEVIKIKLRLMQKFSCLYIFFHPSQKIFTTKLCFLYIFLKVKMTL